MLSMHDRRPFRSVHADRMARQRHELDVRRGQPARHRVRRWVGRHLVRAGARLAGEPTLMRPVRSL